MDLPSVRRALRAHLEARGYDVASDSHGLRNDVYIMGAGDLARALFEFMPSAEEACDTMYQGSWTAGMPPRLAVMPSSESGSAALEMLEQIRVIPVCFETRDAGVEFPGLDPSLDEHLGR
jgi:hypothetical protein